MGAGARYPRHLILSVAEKSLSAIDGKGIIAGSLRRLCPDVGDIDVVLDGIHMAGAISALERSGCTVTDARRPRVELRTPEGFQLDLWEPDPGGLGACLYHATGPGVYNAVMRRWARLHGMTLDLHGVRNSATNKLIASTTEEDCCLALGVPFMPPEHRERYHEWIDPWLDLMEDLERAS